MYAKHNPGSKAEAGAEYYCTAYAWYVYVRIKRGKEGRESCLAYVQLGVIANNEKSVCLRHRVRSRTTFRADPLFTGRREREKVA
jgi:hypothetical protein